LVLPILLRSRRFRASTPAAQSVPEQTVDGMQPALEISARSSYVPTSLSGVRSPGHPERAERGAVTCLELPIWMK
jgi:hypothetical protein